MATAVVSARVSEEVRDAACARISETGSTVNDVIRTVFTNIARGAEIPISEEERERREYQRQRFEEFMAWCDSLPPCPELTNTTGQQTKDKIASRYV